VGNVVEEVLRLPDGDLKMRKVLVSLVLLLAVAAPRLVRGETASEAPATATPVGDLLHPLLERLDLHLIARAQTAECKDEGEACKTDAECCAGLECAGGDPEPTCRQPE
jgi:hypothetical protein